METRDAWASLGQEGYALKSAEQASLNYRRSIYVVEDVKAGDVLDETNIRRIRPGFGLAPKYYDEVIGRRIVKDAKRGTPLCWEMLE
jgi:N-acetylneuraminate synthase